jgi:hypothetical protein
MSYPPTAPRNLNLVISASSMMSAKSIYTGLVAHGQDNYYSTEQATLLDKSMSQDNQLASNAVCRSAGSQ